MYFFCFSGIFKAILCLFDIIEYLLDLHDSITNQIEKYDHEKEDGVKHGIEKYDHEKEDGVKQNMETDVFEYVDMNCNLATKLSLYDTDHVSFTVASAKTQFKSDLSNMVMTFDQVISNEGNGFDSDNGKFSCPTSGAYVFFYSSTKSGENDIISLVQDDSHVDASLYENNLGGTSGDHVSHMALLQLKKDDQVWLKYANDVDAKTKHLQFATFSGFLLYEQ